MRFIIFTLSFFFITSPVCAKSSYKVMTNYNDKIKTGDTIVLLIADTLKLIDLEPISIIGEKAKAIPGSGQYISSRKLAIINQPNINHVLRTIPGVNVRDEEGFGLRPNIGMRGTAVNRSAKITLMEDGILIAPAPYADPSAYYFPTFARMHGVEVLKGSSQIKYGPYTIGGAVNLLSTPIPNTFKGFAQISYGSFGTNQQRLWVGDNRKNFDYVFEVNRLASHGFKELDNGDNTGFDRRDIMGKVRWHNALNASLPQSITLKFVNSTESGNESYLGLTYDDFKLNPRRRYTATQKDLLDMKHNHITLQHTILPSNNFAVNTTAYYTHTFRDWARVNTIGGHSLNNILANPATHQTPYQIMTGTTNGNIDYQSAARTYFAKGIQSNAQYYFQTAKIDHKIQVGIRHHLDQADRVATLSTYTMMSGKMIQTASGVKGNQENQIRNATSTATYMSYDLTYKGLKLSPGLRYENIKFEIQNYGTADNSRLGTSLKAAENKMSIIIPGMGINFDFDEHMSTFGGIHKGFSPPGMPSTTSNATQAREETAINYEIGYRYEDKGWNVQVVGFYSDYDNILGSDNVSGGGAGTGDLFNAGNATVSGLEVSMDYDLLHSKNSRFKLPVHISYTFSDARFNETFVNAGGDWGSGTILAHDIIPFITPHLLSFNIGFESKSFNATLATRYVSTTRIKPGQKEIFVPSENIKYTDVNAINGFLIMDISANYTIGRNFTIFSTINNITNNQGIVTNLPNGYRPNMPFAINLGLKTDF
jgi:Fe(3+) dicitrate transport protein